MRETRQKIKRLAKTVMSGSFFRLLLMFGLQYITAALLVRVFGLLGGKLSPETTFEIFGLTVNYVSVLASVVSAFFAAPLELGIAEYVLGLARRKDVSAMDVFLWYSDGEKLGASAVFGVWGGVCGISQVALLDVPLSYVQTQLELVVSDLEAQFESGAEVLVADYSLMNMNGILVSLAVVILACVLQALFVAVPYIFVDTRKLFSSVIGSLRLMAPHLFAYIVFQLSFAGLYVGTIFTFGLLGIYLIPYYSVSQVMFVEYVRAKDRFDRGEESQQ